MMICSITSPGSTEKTEPGSCFIAPTIDSLGQLNSTVTDALLLLSEGQKALRLVKAGQGAKTQSEGKPASSKND
jgi:hypothetical protein